MAESIKNQVDALTGFAGTEDLALQDWCESGVLELINIFPSKLKEKCMTETTLNNSSPTMDLDGVGKILYVSRLSANSGGYRVPCREVPSMHAGLTSDSSNLLYYGTVTDPVYWIQSTSDAAILNVYPSPEATQTARVYHISHPQVNIASSEIGNFPDEAGYLVVLYAACKAIHRLMNNKSSDLPSDVPSITLLTISTSLPSYTSVDSFVSVPHPIAPIMSAKTVTLNGTAPTYTSPVLAMSSAPSISNLSITAVLPVEPAVPSFTTPGISSITLTNSGVPPQYISPTLTSQTAFADYWTLADFGDSDPGVLTITAVAPVPLALSDNSITFTTTAPTYTPQVVAPDFGDANFWLNTEEDSEMVGARIQVIQSQLQEYQLNIQNELNEFNKENAEYQVQFQKGIKDAELASTDDNQLLQKYSNELQSYQSQVSNQVGEYTQKLSRYQIELNTVYQAWAKTESDNLSKYQIDVSDAVNSFNRQNSEYQVKLQEAIKQSDINATEAQQEASLKLQKEYQEYSSRLQKFSNEVQEYQAKVNEEVQIYQQNFQKEFQIWQTKRQTELQEYASKIQDALNVFNDGNVEYQANIQKDLQDANLAESKEGRDLQKYSQEIASYQAQVQTNVQIFQSALADNTADFANNIQKYTSEVQKVTEVNQSNLAKYSQDIANYGAKVQKNSVDYQWYQGQYAQLKQDYNQGIQLLIGGGNPPQQQRGERQDGSR